MPILNGIISGYATGGGGSGTPTQVRAGVRFKKRARTQGDTELTLEGRPRERTGRVAIERTKKEGVTFGASADLGGSETVGRIYAKVYF